MLPETKDKNRRSCSMIEGSYRKEGSRTCKMSRSKRTISLKKLKNRKKSKFLKNKTH